MRLVCFAFVLGLTACRFPVDPDSARFSCDDSADCGRGYECRTQASGDAGICFIEGQCVAETCDGEDDDCDGRIDNGFDLQTDSQHCGACNHPCGQNQSCLAGQCG